MNEKQFWYLKLVPSFSCAIVTYKNSSPTEMRVAFALSYFISIFRHLRFLLKSAAEMATKQPSPAQLQNQAMTQAAVTSAIQSELSTVSNNQAMDHATIAEEKDGRLNET